MHAIVCRGTKLVLEHNYPHPTPVAGEALIRVIQVDICNTDLEIMRGYMG
jgi:threonine dehydrogenase-like Zn-dependent dehydrogenase